MLAASYCSSFLFHASLLPLLKVCFGFGFGFGVFQNKTIALVVIRFDWLMCESDMIEKHKTTL